MVLQGRPVEHHGRALSSSQRGCAGRRTPRRASQRDARGSQRWTIARHWCLERGQGGGERARKEAQSWPRQDKPRARAGKRDQLGNSKGEARARAAPRARTDCGEAAARSADSQRRARAHASGDGMECQWAHAQGRALRSARARAHEADGGDGAAAIRRGAGSATARE